MARSTCNNKSLSYKYQYIYENFPVGVWEEDWSLIKQRLDQLTHQGVKNLRAYLTANPETVLELNRLISVIAVNQQAIDLYQATSQNQLTDYIRHSEFDTTPFIESLSKLYYGDKSAQAEHWAKTLQGDAICLRECLSIAPGFEDDWGYVITATEDITEYVKKDNIINDQITYLEQASKIAKISYWAANPNDNDNDKILLMGFLSEKFNLPPSGGIIDLADSYRFIHPEDVEKVQSSRAFSFSNRVGYQLEYRLQSESGIISYIREIAEVNKGFDETFIGYHGTLQDVSHQKAHHRQLENIVKKADQLEQQFVNAINAISEGIALYDENHVLIKSNNTYNNYFKQSSSIPIVDLFYHDLINIHLKKISPDGNNSDQIEIWNSICKNKQPLPFEFIDGEQWFKIKKELQKDNSYVVTLSNITELKTRELMLEQLSIMDDLTNLFNRRKFNESLDNEFRRCMRDQKPLSVLICDIDEFKQYNDNYGHIQGDECLKAIAKAIQDQFHRVGDVVARYGGEEFAIILPNSDKDNARKLATALCKAVSSQKIPHEYASNTNHVTLSVGVATTDFDTGCKKVDLIAAADSALYHAKSQGRNCIRSAVPSAL